MNFKILQYPNNTKFFNINFITAVMVHKCIVPYNTVHTVRKLVQYSTYSKKTRTVHYTRSALLGCLELGGSGEKLPKLQTRTHGDKKVGSSKLRFIFFIGKMFHRQEIQNEGFRPVGTLEYLVRTLKCLGRGLDLPCGDLKHALTLGLGLPCRWLHRGWLHANVGHVCGHGWTDRIQR